jgi:glycosyltransferase involved in cell wall biosynthesis
VCPLKIYAYAAVGRPIITGNTQWLVNTHRLLGREIIAGVAVNDPVALANKITELARAPEQRKKMAEESSHFYRGHLANKLAAEKFNAIFGELNQPVEMGLWKQKNGSR